MQLKPHTTLQDGKYEIIRVLGQGGFGITYLAEQTLVDRKVCIKEFFIKEYCERDEATSKVSLGTTSNAEMMRQYMAKFIKEAKTIAKLDHPNIVKIFDVFKENNTAYIVMEYIDGQSLGEHIKQYGPLGEEKAVSYIRIVGDALSYAHSQHVMHLDVKPSNIMLDRAKDRPVLIDFGLAKQYSEGGVQTSSTPVGISQGYAPMEQYQTGGIKEFSPATDVYSLGATLYKLLTGNTPPSASEVNEDGLPPMSESISLTVHQAIDKAMQPRRKDRPQSVEAFLALLDGPTTKKLNTDYEPEEEVTVINKPTSPIEKRVTPLQSQKPVSAKTPSKTAAASVVSAPKDAPKSTNRQPWAKYGVIGGVAALVIVCLLMFLSGGKESVPDNMRINGMQVCTVELESKAIEQEFKIEKNFEERWTYSGVPEWCTASASEGCFKLTLSENKTANDRIATIMFKKKRGESPIAQLAIRQKASEAAIKKISSSKDRGSVRFVSTPPGAAIWVDGKDTQKTTPETIDGLTVGKHNVKLVLDGYESYSGLVNVSSKKRIVLDRTLVSKHETNDVQSQKVAPNQTVPSTKETGGETQHINNGSQQSVTFTSSNSYVYEEVQGETVEEEAIPFQLVEQKPSFNGGDANEFSKWVNKNLNYPEIAKKNGVQGRVTLQFTVNPDGSVSNVTVLRGVDPSLDKEAVRVVSKSPKWKPGRQRDRAVKVTYTFPVIFQLR